MSFFPLPDVGLCYLNDRMQSGVSAGMASVPPALVIFKTNIPIRGSIGIGQGLLRNNFLFSVLSLKKTTLFSMIGFWCVLGILHSCGIWHLETFKEICVHVSSDCELGTYSSLCEVNHKIAY